MTRIEEEREEYEIKKSMKIGDKEENKEVEEGRGNKGRK